MIAARRSRGRPPSIWRGPIGYKFLEAVALTKYNHPRPITTPQAIRIVLRQPDFAPLRKYATRSTRYLEKMLVDTAQNWGPTGVHTTFKELIGSGKRIYWNTK